MKCPYCIKVCTKCGKLLVANEMNFHKDKAGKYGLKAICKECQRRKDKQYREEHRKEIKEKKKQWYLDNKDKHKQYCEQYYENNKNEILEKHKQWREDKKEQIADKRKQYRQNNKNKIAEYNKQYREQHKEEIAEYQKQWRQDNSEYFKQWFKDNPHVAFNNNIKHRHGLNSNITKEQYYEILEYFGYKCAYCGCDLDSDNRTLDHVIPLSKGGAVDPWCIVPCCGSCNSSKKDKNYLLWLDEKEMVDIEKIEKIYKWIEFAFDKYNDN